MKHIYIWIVFFVALLTDKVNQWIDADATKNSGGIQYTAHGA